MHRYKLQMPMSRILQKIRKRFWNFSRSSVLSERSWVKVDDRNRMKWMVQSGERKVKVGDPIMQMWAFLRSESWRSLNIKVDGLEISPYSKSRWPVSWWSPAYMGSPFLSRPISICFIERSGGFSSSLDFSDSSLFGCVVTKNTSLDGGYHVGRL